MPAFRYLCQTRFADVDGFGHVNNAVFLSYLENAREDLYRQSGSGEVLGLHRFILVSHQEIEYWAALRFDSQPVAVDVWVGRLGRTSFDLSYQVSSGDGTTVYAVANTGMVITSRDTGRPVAMSAPERATLERWLANPVRFRAERG